MTARGGRPSIVTVVQPVSDPVQGADLNRQRAEAPQLGPYRLNMHPEGPRILAARRREHRLEQGRPGECLSPVVEHVGEQLELAWRQPHLAVLEGDGA